MVRYLEDEVLNGGGVDGVDWLVVFYPDPRKSYTVYTALRIEQLAKTVRGEAEVYGVRRASAFVSMSVYCLATNEHVCRSFCGRLICRKIFWMRTSMKRRGRRSSAALRSSLPRPVAPRGSF